MKRNIAALGTLEATSSKITRSSVSLPALYEDILTKLNVTKLKPNSQETKTHIEASIKLLISNPPSDVWWLFIFRLINNEYISDILLNYLKSNKEASTTFLSAIIASFKIIKDKPCNMLLYDDITLSWSSAYYLYKQSWFKSIISAHAPNHAGLEKINKSIVSNIVNWLSNNLNSIEWNIAPASMPDMTSFWMICTELGLAGSLINNLVKADVALDFNRAPENCSTPLIKICASSLWKVIEALRFKDYRLDWNKVDSEGHSAFWHLCQQREQWDLVGYYLIKESKLVIDKCLGKLIISWFNLGKAHIIHHLYNTTSNKLNLGYISYGTANGNKKVDEIAKEILRYHPTLTEIYFERNHALDEIDDYPEYSAEYFAALKKRKTIRLMTDDTNDLATAKATFNKIKGINDSLEAEINKVNDSNFFINSSFELAMLLSFINDWREHLSELSQIENTIWYIDELRADYLFNLVVYLQLCIAPKIANKELVLEIIQHLDTILNCAAIAKLSFEHQGAIYYYASLAALTLNNKFAVNHRQAIKFACHGYNAYRQAELIAQNKALGSQLDLFKDIYQYQAKRYRDNKQEQERLIYSELLKDLKLENSINDIVSHPEIMRLLIKEFNQCFNEYNIAMPEVTYGDTVKYWLDSYYLNPSLASYHLQELNRMNSLNKQNKELAEENKQLKDKLVKLEAKLSEPQTPKSNDNYPGPSLFLRK